MISQAPRFWTFNSLVGAFLDLFIAYFLLCGSTIALFAVRFLGLFGLSFQTRNNNGFLGIPNSDFKELMVDFPTDKISAVQFSVARKFPFDSVFFTVQNRNSNLNLDLKSDEFRELEGEASCSSISDARKVVRDETHDSGIKIEKENGFDMKGKRGSNYRVRGGFRRRKRKGTFDHEKHFSVSSSRNWVTCVDQQSNDKESSRGLEDGSIVSGDNSRNYEAETRTVLKSDKDDHQDTTSDDPGNPNKTQETIFVNDDDKYNAIVLLTRELEDEQAARAALYIELEKERNAAATAAEEAMAMILRLQEEKASIEMESRQYQRMIEEKSTYDNEEMNILKEIVLRREREKHFLEKEVETYRQMLNLENDQIYGENSSELRVYDVHVIDTESDVNKKEPQIDDSGGLPPLTGGLPPVTGGLPPLTARSLRRNSMSALDNERTKIDTEVEWLRERLRVVQEGREKLNFSIDNREKEIMQLQLLEDITRQLQEIRILTEPRKARQGSLPLPCSKSSTKKRRCRSASLGPAKSS